MSDTPKKESIFKKMSMAGEAVLDNVINKAKNTTMNSKEDNEEDIYYAKAVVDDPNYKINSQGYKDKPYRITDEFLKQMSLKDVIVAAVIQTRQNLVASYSKLVKSEKEDQGFRIVLKDEETFLEKVKKEIAEEMKKEGNEDPAIDDMVKAEDVKTDSINADSASSEEDNTPTNAKDKLTDAKGNTDDDVEEYNFELERKAKERLSEKIKEKRKALEDFILNCGRTEDRPFESKKWNFDACLRAWVRDSLTYDKMCSELVPDNENKLHHFIPIDGSTIKFSTPDINKYKSFATATATLDFMYPEKQVDYLMDERDVLELDEEMLEADRYKYVQVIRGKIERAYTDDELIFGMRNPTTDIYSNGYSVTELELLVSLVTSHLNAEYYNKAYFTQGFSAKGILHLKAPINRRKLETIRQQWHHMIRGSKNSFQTPIFAGMDEVKWIPLTQSHSDIEFQGWMNYLIKMICAIYQIDPYEIGIGMKDEGRSGGGISGDNTQEKLKISKDKGLRPLLRFIENYINVNIIDKLDEDFRLEFIGIDEESKLMSLERNLKEIKAFKTVNEVRDENGLAPLPGMDDVILDTVYFQWYAQFSKKATEAQALAQEQGGQMDQGDENIDQIIAQMFGDASGSQADPEAVINKAKKLLKKSKTLSKPFSIEYYNMDGGKDE